MPRSIEQSRTAHSPHALLTGASSGLGAALARHYAEQRFRLSLMGRDRGRLMSISEQCRALGGTIETICCDVRDADAMHRELTRIDDEHPVTLVIANAGIGGADALAGEAGESAAAAHDLVSINILGVINTIAPLVPRLRSRGFGHIGVVSSLAARTPLPQAPVYCATKAAVRMYGAALRRRLHTSGVGVTVVCPGFVETPMSASLPMQRPFLATADGAARRIARAIELGKSELAFPWQLALAARLDEWLPSSIGDRLARLSMRDSSR